MGFGELMDGIVSRYSQHQQFKAYELKMCWICTRNLGIEVVESGRNLKVLEFPFLR